MEPAYFRGTKPFKVSVELVISIVKMLMETNRTDDFIAASKDAALLVPPETANLLKDFLAQNLLAGSAETESVGGSTGNRAFAESIVGLHQNRCPDYQCPHIAR